MAKNKKVKQKEIITTNKVPKVVENAESYYSKSPSWKFARIDNEHEKWSFINNNVMENIDIINKLSDYEKQKWKDIIGDHNHFIGINDLIKEAQDRVLELKIFEDSLFSLRVNGKKRIFGILEDGVLSFIWYDNEHKICTSHKKHT